LPQVAANYENHKKEGIDIIVVIGEDYNYSQPTLEFCKNYAKQMGLPLDRTFIDFGSEYGSFETLFTYMEAYPQGGSFALPWEAVIDPDDMEYLYCSMQDPQHNVMAAIWESMQD
jgi:hypothetical protein